MSRRSRPVTRDSRSSAMTAIGSVAAIRAPNTSADFGRPAEPRGEARRDGQRAEHDADGGEREHRDEVAGEIAPAQVKRRLEQQRRQNDVEDQVVGQRETRIDPGRRQRGPRHREPDRIGQAEAPRRKSDQNRKAKKRQRPEHEDVHASCLPTRFRKRNRAPRYSAAVRSAPARR